MTDSRLESLNDRVWKDLRARKLTYGQPTFDMNVLAHAEELDHALRETIGVSYTDALGLLRAMLEGCISNSKDPCPSIFVKREPVIEELAKRFKTDSTTIEKIISGFLLTKESMAKEGRSYWKPQFHYRAYRRAVFVHQDIPAVYSARDSDMDSEIHISMVVVTSWATVSMQSTLANFSRSRQRTRITT